MTKLLFSAQKDEGPFLLEWILYHRLIGFDDIVMYSNDCTDGSYELLDTLASYGLLSHYRTSPLPEESAQGHAANLMFKSDHYKNADWVSWVDADEFICINCDGYNVDALIKNLGAAFGVFMNWRLFGDNNISAWQDGSVLESFDSCARKGNRANNPIKAFFRPHHSIKELYIHRPVLSDNFPEEGLDVLGSDGEIIPMEMVMGKRPHGPPLQVHQADKRRYSLVQVNHYAVRTFDVFSLKKIRGSGMKAIGASEELRGRRHGDQFWVKRNRNEVNDHSVQRHLPILKQEISNWLSKPDIRAAHYNCCSNLAHRLLDLSSKGHAMNARDAGLSE